MQKFLITSFCLFLFIGYSQKKTLVTKFTNETINIDGKDNEESWKTAAVAKDFITYEPDNGNPADPNRLTEVRVLYNNHEIFVYAKLFDSEPDKIMRELAKRDDFGSADFFGVTISGNNDGQQDFEFFVTAADCQGDANETASNGEDFSWDAVWESKAHITDFGWVVEIRIPYAALRFPSSNIQTWGINFFRNIQRTRQTNTWNPVSKSVGTYMQQAGILTGIENIKTPTRLFFLPYTSYYVNADAYQKTIGTLKGGMDVKYGINDAFTLDAILIPDFGQTALDQKTLNLGPFEQQFNENRSFFTEGTDLFSKGGLLYSRRIGGTPTVELALTDDEEIIKSPSIVGMINALKISGRTKSGLGIGLLNAVTENTMATVKNNITGETRREIVEPLTNFNVLVLDQRFRKNSSIAFVNTNVTRNGSYQDANVSALVWDLNTKANIYQFLGDFKFSYVDKITNVKRGVKTGLEFNKISGRWRAGIGGDLFTKDFDINDLGINYQTNYFDVYSNLSYRILQPTKHFNSLKIGFYPYLEFKKNTGKNMVNRFNFKVNLNTKKNNSAGFGLNINPFESYNFFEPRVDGRYSVFPKKIGVWAYISTNYNNKFAIDCNPSYTALNESGRNSYGVEISPRYRFNNKLSLIYNFNFFRQNNNKGWVDTDDFDTDPNNQDDIIYTNRTVVTYSNALTTKYSINSKMNIDLKLQQYWSYAENHNFYTLQNDGTLQDFANYTINKNSSYYNWNVDLSYSYWFAPGSQLSILYRNNASNFEREINKDLGKNITNLLNNDALNHTFSISVKYFIDYNKATHWF